MRKVLWEMERKKRHTIVAAIAVIVIIALVAVALSVGVGASCETTKASRYATWNDTQPLLELVLRSGATEDDAAALARDSGLEIRQLKTTLEGMSVLVTAVADKADRIQQACALEKNPLIVEARLIRPLFYTEDGA